jgi:hypothetical protein
MRRIFDAKWMQIEPKMGPKTGFYMAFKRGLGTEKAPALEPNRGLDELRISPSGLGEDENRSCCTALFLRGSV